MTVSGATTANILDKPQRIGLPFYGRTFAPQIQGIPEDCDIVTITAGGNDLGYSLNTIRNALTGWLQALSPITSPLGYILSSNIPKGTEQEVAQVTEGLVKVVEAARKRAPKARIILVDYLTMFGPEAVMHPVSNPLSPEQIAALRALGKKLDEAFAEAARRTGAELVKASALSENHGVSSAEPWVYDLDGYASKSPYHPNAAGMQAIADELYRVIMQ